MNAIYASPVRYEEAKRKRDEHAQCFFIFTRDNARQGTEKPFNRAGPGVGLGGLCS